MEAPISFHCYQDQIVHLPIRNSQRKQPEDQIKSRKQEICATATWDNAATGRGSISFAAVAGAHGHEFAMYNTSKAWNGVELRFCQSLVHSAVKTRRVRALSLGKSVAPVRKASDIQPSRSKLSSFVVVARTTMATTAALLLPPPPVAAAADCACFVKALSRKLIGPRQRSSTKLPSWFEIVRPCPSSGTEEFQISTAVGLARTDNPVPSPPPPLNVDKTFCTQHILYTIHCISQTLPNSRRTAGRHL